jgi:hypothetical protein
VAKSCPFLIGLISGYLIVLETKSSYHSASNNIIMSSVMAATETVRTILLSNGNTLRFGNNESSCAESIPLIDVSRMYSDNIEDRRALAEDVRKASREIGFFYMVNHVSSTNSFNNRNTTLT